MKRKILIIVLCLAAAVAAALVTWYLTHKEQGDQGQDVTNDHPTNITNTFEDGTPPADPMLVGKWQNVQNPQWHKVYYDDYDEEQKLYWGKEWDENEDVMEEDLLYHGNGWFRWKKQGKVLHEYYTMDAQDIPIHREYRVCRSAADSLLFFEPDYPKDLFRFGKVK